MKLTPKNPINSRYLKPYEPKDIQFPSGFCLIVDTREQHSPLFLDKPPKGLMVMRDTLKNGDYSIYGFPEFIVEKKYAGDLFPYCSTEMESKTKPKMERFKQIISSNGWVGLVIEDSMSGIFKHQEFTKIHPESVRWALAEFRTRYGVHVHFAVNRENAARWILENAVYWYKMKKEL